MTTFELLQTVVEVTNLPPFCTETIQKLFNNPPGVLKPSTRKTRDKVVRYLREDVGRIWSDECELVPLTDAARWAARCVPIDGYELHELEYESLLRIVCDFNKIRAARCPEAFARHIAQQHLRSLRHQESRRVGRFQPASHVQTPGASEDEDGSWEAQSTSTKLDYLSGDSRVDAWWRARSTAGIFGRLHAAIDTLEEDDRRIIRSSFGFDDELGDMSVEEIAERLGMPVSSVYRRRKKALKTLRTILSDLRFRRT
jgi:RNA polymerase sigma factor (sigma-70 family)